MIHKQSSFVERGAGMNDRFAPITMSTKTLEQNFSQLKLLCDRSHKQINHLKT